MNKRNLILVYQTAIGDDIGPVVVPFEATETIQELHEKYQQALKKNAAEWRKYIPFSSHTPPCAYCILGNIKIFFFDVSSYGIVIMELDDFLKNYNKEFKI